MAPVYPFKTVIPVAGMFLLLQGFVEIVRCVICIKQGEWPSREIDVEEVDVDKLKEMVHVKDEDIEQLDKFVVEQGPGKMRKELWFGFILMALLLAGCVYMLVSAPTITNGHLGLLMLGLVVVAIMLGFPTAFTLMGMGMLFGWLAYRSVNPALANRQILDLMVQRAYSVMSNDVLIAIPLFVFMGYLVERANLIEKLFKSLHLAMARVPGSLAVATIVTCAIFATATGIVGAVVTLMGLLALPAMLRAGYNVKVSAGAITAGGCLGILIPPSVLLIVYGATAGVSVVQLYAGAFFPGIMLALLYVGYVIVLAKLKPHLAPPLSESERHVPLPPLSEQLSGRHRNALAGLFGALPVPGLPKGSVLGQLLRDAAPAISITALLVLMYGSATAPPVAVDTSGLVQAGGGVVTEESRRHRRQDCRAVGRKRRQRRTQRSPSRKALLQPRRPPRRPPRRCRKPPSRPCRPRPPPPPPPAAQRVPAPTWFWITFGVGVGSLVLVSWMMNWQRLEIFKMLLTSFFPLAVMILAVLGSIVFGLATPTEAAAVGGFGGLLLAGAYRYIAAHGRPREPSDPDDAH